MNVNDETKIEAYVELIAGLERENMRTLAMLLS